MDVKTTNGFRKHNIERLKIDAYQEYDYEKNGILCKCLPKILFSGNAVLVSFLQLIDLRLIMMFKSIDKIKHFKNIARY